MVSTDFVRNAGDMANLADAEAARLIEAGYAEPVKVPEQIETATLPAQVVETATVEPRRRKAKPKRRKAK